MRLVAALLVFLTAAFGIPGAIVIQAHYQHGAGQFAADNGQCARQRGDGACQPQPPAPAAEVPPPSSLFAIAPAVSLPPSSPAYSPASPTLAGLRPMPTATTHESTAPASVTQDPASTPPQAAGVRPDGVPAAQVGSLVLDDSAAALWSTWNHTTSAGADCADSPGTVTLSATELDLTTSGMVGNCAEATSVATYRYGIFEARIWTQAAPNGLIANWPAFWLVGHNWPVDGEIDGFEGLHGYDSASFHYGANNSYLTRRDSALKPGWNVVDIVWKPQMLAVYYNGQKFVEWDSPVITSQPMVVIFDNTTGNFGYTTGQPSTLRVAYLRIWTAA
jgi:hypothetical protein